jgi:CDP-2,3-bis-(O-geranylgeranyl)-sn-glycerol synthase
MTLVSAAQCFALIATANIVPPAVSIVTKERCAWPVDGGLDWLDGRPLFGRSKTLRGIILAVVGGVAVGPLIGVTWTLAAFTALSAMAGDLFSSFCKRRLGLGASAPAPGLDQIPESLLPAIACAGPLGLSWYDIVTIVVLFTIGDAIVSPDYRRWRFPWEKPVSSGH